MFLKLVLLFTLALPLFAHQTGLSYLEVKENEKHKIAIVYKKPLSDTQAQGISFRYPSRCSQTTSTQTEVVNGYIIKKYSLWCGDNGLKDSRIWVDGLVAKNRGVMVRYEYNELLVKRVLKAATPFIYIEKSSGNIELFIEYVTLGIEHIFNGIDHLLFVLSLVLLSLNTRALMYAITAFTLSHSITLALAILEFVTIPILYVEAMIALSIVILAKELLLSEKGSFTRRHLGVVAFTFGLLHGFGFSSVLASIGLPQDEIPLSLFAFNVGIEIGQVLFILGVSFILSIFIKYFKKYNFYLEKIIAYSIGSIASYWLIERVSLF